MKSELATPSLLPPRPNQQLGWGRMKWVLSNHSTASMEIELGVGAVARGVWQIIYDYPHDFWWSPQVIAGWGWFILWLGILQVLSCVYRWDRLRSAVATILCGAIAYVAGVYFIHDPQDIAVVLYITLLVGEIWIALRGHRMLGSQSMNGDHQPGEVS